MNWSVVALFTLLFSVEAFTAPSSSTPLMMSAAISGSASSLRFAKGKGEADAPPLRSKPPRNICLMVEPTPFTHVSGYANRFQEMLKFLKKAGDNVDVLTVDSKTPAQDLPKSFMGFPIEHTLGFTFPLYNQISLTFDLPEAKGAAIIERRKPDLIHVTSPYVYYILLTLHYRISTVDLCTRFWSLHSSEYSVGGQNSIQLAVVTHVSLTSPSSPLSRS